MDLTVRGHEAICLTIVGVLACAVMGATLLSGPISLWQWIAGAL